MYGLWFPAKTPAARVNRMHAEVRKMVGAPDVKAKLEELGLAGVASTPGDFKRFIDEDIAFQTQVMTLAKIDKQ